MMGVIHSTIYSAQDALSTVAEKYLHLLPRVPYPKWTLLAVLTSVIYISRQVSAYRNFTRFLPPGPRGLPIVGNLFQLNLDAWHTFAEWKEQYGPLVHISVAGQSILIMNTHKVTADLLDRRGPIYSDRPRFIVASEILTGGLLLVFAQYNDIWRRMRRAGHEGLNKTVSADFYPFQQREAVYLVDGMLKDPKLWNQEIGRATASMVFSAVYDKPPIISAQDPQITRANEFIARLSDAAFPGAYYVEFFTWMKYLPSSIAKWKCDAEEWFRKDSEVFEGLFLEVQDRVKNGEVRPSFAANLIRDSDKYGLSDRESAWLAASLYTAGSETTAGVLNWFMLAMVLYSDVQKKIQEELDAVVGRDRAPSFVDREHLPYLQATVRETLRWNPVAPVGKTLVILSASSNVLQGLPHQLTQDDWYDGYFIPKGTICVPNVWSMNRDVEVYGLDASKFNPRRFLDEEGQLKPALADTKDEGHMSYGFGRRLCIGRHVANNSLFIDIACILWAANIGPVHDSQGKPMTPIASDIINDGIVVRPSPFDCSITPRFPEVKIVLAQSKESVGSY